MRADHWNSLVHAARGEPAARTPVALIVDTPWIPPFLGISTVDYIGVPDVWLEANLAVARRFPDVIFLPGFWVSRGWRPSRRASVAAFSSPRTSRRPFTLSFPTSRRRRDSRRPTLAAMASCPSFWPNTGTRFLGCGRREWTCGSWLPEVRWLWPHTSWGSPSFL